MVITHCHKELKILKEQKAAAGSTNKEQAAVGKEMLCLSVTFGRMQLWIHS